MSYSHAAPGPELEEFVERVCFSSDEGGGRPPAVRVVPDGGIDVLFSIARGGACAAQVFGIKTRPYWAESDDPRDNVLLRLRPGAATRLFGVAASELTDRAPELRELAGRAAAEWCERLSGASGPRERHELLARSFGAWAARTARAPDVEDSLLHAAVLRIQGSVGSVSIAALAAELGAGPRRLERVFEARIGVSPKRFARVVRFFAAYQSLGSGREPLDAALAHGYFDQAHLNRDFRALAGAPPRRIFPSPAGRALASLPA